MIEVRPNLSATLNWLIAIVGLVAPEAEAQGRAAQSIDKGTQVQKKIQISLSVRPTMRIRQMPLLDNSPAALPSLCLWSNFQIGQYSLRAEWSDGRSSDIGIIAQTKNSCNQVGLRLVQVAIPPSPSAKQGNDPVVTLMVTPQ